jgi:hypothetical protein
MDDGSGTANGMRFGITEAAHHGDERTAVLGVLQRQRDLVGWKLRDAPDEVLGVASTPTGMSLAGLVRHFCGRQTGAGENSRQRRSSRPVFGVFEIEARSGVPFAWLVAMCREPAG